LSNVPAKIASLLKHVNFTGETILDITLIKLDVVVLLDDLDTNEMNEPGSRQAMLQKKTGLMKKSLN
jgi:hypothetical protein